MGDAGVGAVEGGARPDAGVPRDLSPHSPDHEDQRLARDLATEEKLEPVEEI